MAKVSVYNMEGTSVGEMDLKDEIFGVEVNEHLLHLAVVTQLANKRQGTQSARTRSDVSGGGKKPWRQKGTGHARQGSTRAPQWVGGGVVFAPKPREYSLKMNKKERKIAMKSALTTKVAAESFLVLEELAFDEIKTKNFVKVLKNLNAGKKVLVVLPEKDQNVELSARNVANTKLAYINTMNVYDILNCSTLITTKAAVEKMEEVYA